MSDFIESQELVPSPVGVIQDIKVLIEAYAPGFQRRHPIRGSLITNNYYSCERNIRLIQNTFAVEDSGIHGSLRTTQAPEFDSGVASLPEPLAPRAILARDCNIYAPPGGGVTHELLCLAHYALGEKLYLPIYLNLVALDEGFYLSLVEEAQEQIRLLGSLELQLQQGNLLFLLDNFDRVSLNSRNQATRFIESLYHYNSGDSADGNRIIVGSTDKVEINSEFIHLEIAPWNKSQISQLLGNITAYPQHFALRLFEPTKRADFITLVQNIATALGKVPQNLALIYESYLPTVITRLSYFLPLERQVLEQLLVDIADSREGNLDFDYRDWKDAINTILQRKNFALTPENKSILTADNILLCLIKSGILELQTFTEFGFVDKSLLHFLIARSCKHEGFSLAYFDPDFFRDPDWHPVALFYLEVLPPQDREEARTGIIQLIETYAIDPEIAQPLLGALNEMQIP